MRGELAKDAVLCGSRVLCGGNGHATGFPYIGKALTPQLAAGFPIDDSRASWYGTYCRYLFRPWSAQEYPNTLVRIASWR